MHHMKEIVSTQLSDIFNMPYGWSIYVSIRIYLFLPHYQFLLSQVSTNIKCTLMRQGLTSLLREAKADEHH